MLQILMLFVMVFSAPGLCDPAFAEDEFSKSNAGQDTRQIQKQLMELGYAPGKLDGRWGRQTENALKEFQRDKHLPATGEIDSETRFNLGLIIPGKAAPTEDRPAKSKKDNLPSTTGEIDSVSLERPGLISSGPAIRETQQSTIHYFDWMLVGGLLMLGFYHLCLFGLNKNDLATCYFGCLCLTTIFLYVISDQNIFVTLFPNFGLSNTLKVEYLSIYVNFAIFVMFVERLYPEVVAPKTVPLAQCFALLFTLATLAIPAAMHRYVTMTCGGAGLIWGAYFVYVLARAIRQNLQRILLFVAGFVFLVTMIVTGSVYDERIIHTGPFVSLGILIFFFVQSVVILSLRSSKSSDRGLAYARFVPKEFMKNLEKVDVEDVELGDNVQKDMSILFSDIRGFTALSEQMTPEQNFNFINSYLSVMGPVIRSHHGFINKYMGDAIMALFDRSADDAVMGAIAMLRELGEYNEGRKHDGYPPIEIGIGINTGAVRLGTVGENGRMEGTVFGDVVNVSSRIERMTKTYGVSLLISDSTYQCLEKPEKYHVRKIDNVKAKGKTEPVTIYEVFDCDPADTLNYKLDIAVMFEDARSLYEAGQFQEANEFFQRCLARNPHDKTAQVYKDRCKKYMDMGSYENRDVVYARFVPKEFIRNLEKVDIGNVELGDNVQKDMSILFSDIRGFTALSEQMTPEQNFNFINSYLSVMGPVIRNHHGFIDKYIGDAIMALFDRSADDALMGAIAMLRELGEYNEGRKRARYAPIEIGIGINTGTLRLGTVGESGRMEGTVIGDAVNVSSRIEGMTKTYGVSLLISDATYRCLEKPEKYHVRKIDNVKAKGKTEPVTIYEVFDCDPADIVNYKLDIAVMFEDARSLYESGQFNEARELFLDCLARNPHDKTAQVYRDRCKLYMDMGSDKNMEGIARRVTYVSTFDSMPVSPM